MDLSLGSFTASSLICCVHASQSKSIAAWTAFKIISVRVRSVCRRLSAQKWHPLLRDMSQDAHLTLIFTNWAWSACKLVKCFCHFTLEAAWGVVSSFRGVGLPTLWDTHVSSDHYDVLPSNTTRNAKGSLVWTGRRWKYAILLSSTRIYSRLTRRATLVLGYSIPLPASICMIPHLHITDVLVGLLS